MYYYHHISTYEQNKQKYTMKEMDFQLFCFTRHAYQRKRLVKAHLISGLKIISRKFRCLSGFYYIFETCAFHAWFLRHSSSANHHLMLTIKKSNALLLVYFLYLHSIDIIL